MESKSDAAVMIRALYLQVIGWDSLVLLIVIVSLTLALFVYSSRGQPGERPVQGKENLPLEIAWTAGPAVILALIAIPAIRIGFQTQPAEPPPGSLMVRVIGHQWWWEIRYPQYQNLITANEFHLPRGRPVRFLLESADVIHSFWIPQLAARRDLIPGKTNEATIRPTVTGEYIGECGEFCGLSHANMQFRVFVDEPADFDKWIAHMSTPPSSPTGTAQAGAQLFAASPCTSCHAISGVSFSPLGPNLNHFGSRTTLASGTLKNTPDQIKAWIANPEKLKPGVQMPALALDPARIDEMVAYLESLK